MPIKFIRQLVNDIDSKPLNDEGVKQTHLRDQQINEIIYSKGVPKCP